MDNPTLITIATAFFVPSLVLAASVVARVSGDLATQSEARQSSRIGRIEGSVSRVAAGIARDMAQLKAGGTLGDDLKAAETVAVANGAQCLADALPDTLKKAGATPQSLMAMLQGAVDQHTLAAAPALLMAGAQALLPVAPTAAQPDTPVPPAPAADPAPAPAPAAA